MSTESLRIPPVSLAGDFTEPLQRITHRAGGFSPQRVPIAAPFSFAAVLALWFAASALGWVNPLALPNPIEVLQALIATAVSGELAVNLCASLQRLAIGWSLGAGCGVVVGFAIGMSSLARSNRLSLELRRKFPSRLRHPPPSRSHRAYQRCLRTQGRIRFRRHRGKAEK